MSCARIALEDKKFIGVESGHVIRALVQGTLGGVAGQAALVEAGGFVVCYTDPTGSSS